MASHNTHKFKSNTIVMWKTGVKNTYNIITRKKSIKNTYTPAFIEAVNNSNEFPDTWQYSITIFDKKPFFTAEDNLRPITLREFACFRHPKTGNWMVGKTRGWMAYIIHLISLNAITLSLREAFEYGNLAALSVTAISLATIILFWIYTNRNLKGKTV